MRKVIFITIGMISLIIAVTGSVVPFVPSTPLLLFSLFCFTRGSKRVSSWFRQTAIYRIYLSGIYHKREMSKKQKVAIEITSGTAMLISFILFDNWIIRASLIAAFVAQNYLLLFGLKSNKPVPSIKFSQVQNKHFTDL